MTPLRQRMIEDMQLRNLAAGTQKHYISLVAGFAKYFGTSPENLDIEAVCNGPQKLDTKRPFLRWWAALKMKESQCPEHVRVTRPV
jgi:hypothetical protein